MRRKTITAKDSTDLHVYPLGVSAQRLQPEVMLSIRAYPRKTYSTMTPNEARTLSALLLKAADAADPPGRDLME